jgi:hypothetical protein
MGSCIILVQGGLLVIDYHLGSLLVVEVEE